MASHQCPRCAGPVSRGGGGVVARQFGLVGALVGMAFAGFQCAACGDIPKSEFPPEVRSSMMLGSLAMVGGAVFVLFAVIAILVALNS